MSSSDQSISRFQEKWGSSALDTAAYLTSQILWKPFVCLLLISELHLTDWNMLYNGGLDRFKGHRWRAKEDWEDGDSTNLIAWVQAGARSLTLSIHQHITLNVIFTPTHIYLCNLFKGSAHPEAHPHRCYFGSLHIFIALCGCVCVCTCRLCLKIPVWRFIVSLFFGCNKDGRKCTFTYNRCLTCYLCVLYYFCFHRQPWKNSTVALRSARSHWGDKRHGRHSSSMHK